MKRRGTILFGAIVFLVIVVGCSDGPRHYDPVAYACDAECEAQRQADREYMAQNFPTREQKLQVRACATAKTGYDEFADLPPDDGPPSLTPGTPKPVHRIEEDMPFRLVERALVAVGQRKPLRERVYAALDECVFELGFEDNYILPRHQDTFRPRNS